MADITDPRVLAFVNDVARPMADALEAFYWRAKGIRTEYVQGGIAGLFTQDASPIRDAANPLTGTPNGKKQLTGYAVGALMDDLAAFVTDMEASGGAKLGRTESVASHLSMFDEANRVG